mgnify:CR=1 FL=1
MMKLMGVLQELDVKAGGGQVMTIGTMLRQWLVKLEWFSTLFPRIPVPIQQKIQKHLEVSDYFETGFRIRVWVHFEGFLFYWCGCAIFRKDFPRMRCRQQRRRLTTVPGTWKERERTGHERESATTLGRILGGISCGITTVKGGTTGIEESEEIDTGRRDLDMIRNSRNEVENEKGIEIDIENEREVQTKEGVRIEKERASLVLIENIVNIGRDIITDEVMPLVIFHFDVSLTHKFNLQNLFLFCVYNKVLFRNKAFR